MSLKKIISYAVKELISTYITMVLMIGLGILFYEFIPEHWGKLTILSIVLIVYVDIKLFSKESGRK
ncbi:hypothetical protein F6Q07_13240 [Pectobacterium parmentieri]|uniref:hypothetical protein n=1 Tax=Pectobacterium parmentieri TaxID=1905730 RepID=UPI000EB38E0C|nr:hypothetical protein [Pectobacterium parmentieri]AYH00189.1 hypothetical protein C5E26_04075 [Pectobacterium parmentieri]AYH26434.1 hypothetical protein C5E20_04345 [Pectobacterium parmentieri]AYH30887.1 hypothetical protein C5E19_04160 [Pectobacterium parmentieri]MBI0519094.1 hypothetical protein [Pectobacterium parmentieri]